MNIKVRSNKHRTTDVLEFPNGTGLHTLLFLLKDIYGMDITYKREEDVFLVMDGAPDSEKVEARRITIKSPLGTEIMFMKPTATDEEIKSAIEKIHDIGIVTYEGDNVYSVVQGYFYTVIFNPKYSGKQKPNKKIRLRAAVNPKEDTYIVVDGELLLISTSYRHDGVNYLHVIEESGIVLVGESL